jgi:hypothetical protein
MSDLKKVNASWSLKTIQMLAIAKNWQYIYWHELDIAREPPDLSCGGIVVVREGGAIGSISLTSSRSKWGERSLIEKAWPGEKKWMANLNKRRTKMI